MKRALSIVGLLSVGLAVMAPSGGAGALTTKATTTTTTTPAPAPSCGGQSTLVSDGSTWTCSFDSEFTGTSYSSAQWAPVVTATSGYTSGRTACFVNTPNNISVGNGYLSLTARKEAAPFTCKDPLGSFQTQYTSGDLTTYGLFSQTYGRFEVDAKVPASTVRGLQSSFWLYPQNETKFGAWPATGEIDIAETYSQYPTLAIPYIHYYSGAVVAATDTNLVTATNCTIATNQFNDYVVEWTPGTIKMIYNGQTCLVDHWTPASPLSGLEPFNQPFFVNLTQALGLATNAFNPSTTQLPATTEIKFVRVWQQS
ncbi:MAG TPA: glycoside hydrolase family 16 protein [Acidimicrobiales bacterium]